MIEPKNPSGPRVLIVDDDPAIVELLAGTLLSDGLVPETATSGNAALDHLSHEKFDAIISDLHMPGMSGLDLLTAVREEYPEMAFLMATGEGDIRVGIQAMRQGAADYLVKPFHPSAVTASLARALQMKQMERELKEYRSDLERMVEDRTKQLERARQRIEMTYDETLEALGGALDMRDSETSGHSYRVTSFSLELARVLECSPDQLKQIARGAFLHDIGKIGVPDSILLKNGKLTDEERAIMETHARVGYDLISRIVFLAPAAEIILTHQERYDGLGYPQGLIGEEMPLGSRIFAVADTLDAMTSDRPYRRALSYATARAEITKESGRQFDPKVVDAFLKVPEKVWANIRRQVSEHMQGRNPGIATRTLYSGDANLNQNSVEI